MEQKFFLSPRAWNLPLTPTKASDKCWFCCNLKSLSFRPPPRPSCAWVHRLFISKFKATGTKLLWSHPKAPALPEEHVELKDTYQSSWIQSLDCLDSSLRYLLMLFLLTLIFSPVWSAFLTGDYFSERANSSGSLKCCRSPDGGFNACRLSLKNIWKERL